LKEKKGPSRASRYKKTKRGCAKPVPRPQAKAAGGRIRNNFFKSGNPLNDSETPYNRCLAPPDVENREDGFLNPNLF
jgi:hypothetical protein